MICAELPGDGLQRGGEVGGGGGTGGVDEPLDQDATEQRLVQGADRPGGPLIAAAGIQAINGAGPQRPAVVESLGHGGPDLGVVLGGAITAALKALQAGLAFGPSRTVLAPLLPRPGQGPSDKTRRTGFFRIQIHTRTSAGASYLATIGARGDPGYAATSVMLGESALCLALDRDRLPDRAGVLTPATAMGTTLAGRLITAGHTLTTQPITQ